MSAARELLNSGFPRESLHLLAYRDGARVGGDDEIVNELGKIGIGSNQAKDCVKSLKDGQVVLAATPPDTADQTVAILDRHDPIDAGGRATDGGDAEDDAAPLSHALHLKVLSDDPAPLSHWLHIPVLTDD